LKQITTFTDEGFNIDKEAAKIWKLLMPYHNGKRMPEIIISTRGVNITPDGTAWIKQNGYMGLAYIAEHRIWLKANPTWETLAHELVHLAVGVRRGVSNYRAHDKVFYDCLRDVAQRRFKVRISFFEVTRYGYDVDAIIERQLHDLGVFNKKEVK
jgi:predicted SprT family Zn-dependent metalloprotease